MRKCPKASCQKPFLKEAGCNKITWCAHELAFETRVALTSYWNEMSLLSGSCGTVSCYVCRMIITNGYSHFDQREPEKSLLVLGGSTQLKRLILVFSTRTIVENKGAVSSVGSSRRSRSVSRRGESTVQPHIWPKNAR